MNTYTAANNVRRADAFRIPAAEVLRRIAALQAHLQSRGLAGALLFQRIDILYFSGTAQSGCLFIPDQDAATLFIRRHLPRARAESPLEHILPIDSLSSLPGLLYDCYGAIPEVMGLEFDVLPVRTYRYLQSLFPGIELVDASLPVHRTRMIKSAWELEQLMLTAALSCQIFDYVRTAIAPGITEIDLSGRIEAFARKIGHSGGLRNRDSFSVPDGNSSSGTTSESLKDVNREGVVAVHFTVLPDGRVKDNVYFEQTSVHRDLNQAAMKAIRQFKFAPLPASRVE